MTQPVITDCRLCDGSGRRPMGHPNDPEPPTRLCTACSGTGHVEIEAETCEQEDRDE